MNNEHFTIVDIARMAGVSRSTVSRALNDNPEISAETKTRVMDVIAQTGYRPNVYARRVVMQLCNSIGLCLGHRVKIRDANAHVLEGVIAKSAEEGYDLLICGGRTPEEMVNMYLERRVDGFIVLNPYPQDRGFLELLEARGVPYVCTGTLDMENTCCSIDTNNAEAAYAAVQHLAELGHRRIALLGATDQIDAIRQRAVGYRRFMTQLPPQPDGPWETVVRDAEGGYDFSGLAAMLHGEHPITACFAVSDSVAMQAVSWLQLHGYRVPEDVSVMGFDDLPEVLMGYPLTTVHQDFSGRGYNSCRLLLAQIRADADDARKVQRFTPYTIVQRGSTAAPKK